MKGKKNSNHIRCFITNLYVTISLSSRHGLLHLQWNFHEYKVPAQIVSYLYCMLVWSFKLVYWKLIWNLHLFVRIEPLIFLNQPWLNNNNYLCFVTKPGAIHPSNLKQIIICFASYQIAFMSIIVYESVFLAKSSMVTGVGSTVG